MKNISISELRKRMSYYVRMANSTSEPIIITRFGKPVCVLIGYDRFKKFKELQLQFQELDQKMNR